MVFAKADGTHAVYGKLSSRSSALFSSLTRRDCAPPPPLCSLADWKRSKNIKMSGGDKAKWPVEQLRDNNYTKYSLQLTLYASILERCYGLKISELVLIVCHPNQNGFMPIVVTPLTAEINTILDLRMLQLIKDGHKPLTAEVEAVVGPLSSAAWKAIC